MDKIFWNFATFLKILDSPQVKLWLISGVKVTEQGITHV